MATNELIDVANNLQFDCPATVLSGDPVVIGRLAAVANTSYKADTQQASFDLEGAYFLPVTAASALSPFVAAAIGAGDPVYADGGVLDAATNVLTGFTLTSNAAGGANPLFGNALDPVGAGLTATIRVRLALGGKDY